MRMRQTNQRTDLTDAERELVGAPGDLVSEEQVGRRPRSSTVMISLRVDRGVFDELSRLAEERDRTLSETVRHALRIYVDANTAEVSYPVTEHGLERAGNRVSESTRMTWTDDDLDAALRRYQAESQEAGMREKAWRSYVDYARRFLAWRTGDYQPRGTSTRDRPVPRGAVSTGELRRQVTQYVRQIEDAGRERETVETYQRHAMFFIRWLEGDFRPGARLRGLR